MPENKTQLESPEAHLPGDCKHLAIIADEVDSQTINI